jgi:hypothetical protein
MVRIVGVTMLALVALVAAGAAIASGSKSSFDSSHTITLDGARVFPLVLAQGPPANGTTPWGTNALTETAGAGVDFFKIGPTGAWTNADIANALAYDRAAKAHHVYTWVNLSGYGSVTPGSSGDIALQRVVQTLTKDAGGAAIGMWKAIDEPWWVKVPPSALQFSYCRMTARGDPSWCAGEQPLDPGRLWVTIEAPRGAASDLAPYTAVTDVHGVDDYPVTIANPSPDLHQVGEWTSTLASITPAAPVWTTLQVCATGSRDASGNFVLPTFQQERYMAYDAIVNGARALAFYGGNQAACWNSTDTQYGWSWTFWQSVLRPLVQQLSARSPLAPALLNTSTTASVASNDPTTEAIARQGATVDELWVVAARSGPGSVPVTFSGLPSWVGSGTVYTENRSVAAANGSLTDTFGQWDVHVYRFFEPPALTTLAPALGAAGVHVRLNGTGLASTTGVAFGKVAAHFAVASDGEVTATVPRRARSAPITVTTPGGTAATPSAFAVLPSVAKLPRITGSARVGIRLRASTGGWYGDRPTRFAYRWQRCNRHGRGCARIPGATHRTYVVPFSAAGERLRVVVIASTHAGSGRARSAPTPVLR